MENFENVNTKGGELLRGLMSEKEVHGLGRERFSETERTEIKALLSSAGRDMADEQIDRLSPRTVMDMIEYAQGGLELEDKKNFGVEIAAQIREECGVDSIEYKRAA